MHLSESEQAREQKQNICKWVASLATVTAAALILIFSILYNSAILTAVGLNGSFTADSGILQQNQTTTEFSTPSDHTPLLPLQPSDLWGFLLAALGLILASGGGIGGGGMLVPIYILVLGFLPKHAIPLSNVTVFGGAIANTWFNIRKRHPVANRPLIDWDLILVMEPPTLFGALVGANLNKVLSETIIAVMLVLLLSFTAYSTFKKAIKMYKVETLELNGNKSDPLLNQYFALDRNEGEEAEENGAFEYEEFCLGRPSIGQSNNMLPIQLNALDFDQSSHNNNLTAPEFDNPLLLEAIINEERDLKPRNLAVLVSMFLVVILVNILKGGGGYTSPIGIACGSVGFWMTQLLLLVFIVAIGAISRKILIWDTNRKTKAGYKYLKEDTKWDERSTVVYPLVSSIAGFCAGMFGVGGGIVKGPLMLAMGIHPAVASATSACMILFTSFTATTTFAVYGMLVKDYAIICMILGLVSTAFGQKVMSKMVKKTKRDSYIAFSIGVSVLLSAILMTIQSVFHMMSDKVDEEFSGICAAHLNGPQV